MNISKDCVVQLHYSLFDEQDNLIESTSGGNALVYLHGHDNMIPGFEKALEGKAAGEHVSITLTPEQAYGARRADAIQRGPVKHLSGAKLRKEGKTAAAHTWQR